MQTKFVLKTRYSLGNRWKPTDRKAKLIYNKSARRVLRGRLSRINRRGETKLQRCREADLEIAKLAINSHQRQRAIAADRLERRNARKQRVSP